MFLPLSLPPPSLAFICLLVSNDPDLINNNKQEENKYCNNKFTNDGQQFPLARSKSTWQFPAEWQAVSLSFFLSPSHSPYLFLQWAQHVTKLDWMDFKQTAAEQSQLVCHPVCMHARGITYNHRFVSKIVQVSGMSSVATLNSNCNCSNCTRRLFNFSTQ